MMLTQLQQIRGQHGSVLHAMKNTDQGFSGFGEAYFSTVNKGSVKGWKKHHEMTMNLIVVSGCVNFVIYFDAEKKFKNFILSLKNYQRLTVPPGLWIAFKGIENNNIILNLANIKHDPNEVETLDLDALHYDW